MTGISADEPRRPVTSAVTADLLLARAESDPGKTFALFESGERWTYVETLQRAWGVAAGLQDLGIDAGEPVLVWLPNGPESIVSFLGTTCAGAVYAPLNTDYRGTLLEHAINLPRAKLLILHEDLLSRLEGTSLPHLRTLVIVGRTGSSAHLPQRRGVRVLTWSELSRPDAAAPPPWRRRKPTDDMTYIYTSGTTGPSKAVRCSYVHHEVYAEWFHHADLGADDRALVTLPMFHVGGTNWVYNMLLWGGSIAMVPRFSTPKFWGWIREFQVTTTTIMAAMATFLVRRQPVPGEADNTLRIALLVPHIPQADEFARRFDVKLWTGFAMTEAPGPLRTRLRASDLRTVGTATNDDWRVRLVDEQGRDVANDEVGELLLQHARANAITAGYVNMPDATSRAWADGWFHTGDLFKRDSEGNFYFVDRSKDSLRRRGENISSYELEAEIVAHPLVREAAAVGVAAAEGDQDVMVFVVLREGAELTAEQLVEFLIPRLPHFMVPRFVEFIERLPRTATEKIQKADLRSGGPGPNAWDRERAGIVVKATRVGDA